MKKLTAFLAMLCLFGQAAALDLPPQIRQYTEDGINGIYQLDFDTAQKNIDAGMRLYPDHPFAHFGNAMIAWSRFEYEYEKSNERQRKVFEKTLDESIAGVKRWMKSHPDDANAHMALGGLYGLRALFNMNNRNWVTAYFAGRKAISHMEKSLALDPEFYDAYFGLGIYQYYAGTLPSVIKILAKIVAIKGDPDEGVRQLNLAREKAIFTSDSAKLILIEIYNTRNTKYYNPQESLRLIRQLRAKYPRHPLLNYVEIICLYENGMYDEALEDARTFLGRIGKDEFYKDIYIPRAYTALGTSYMAKGQYQEAIEAFEEGKRAINNQEPSRWGVWNLVRLGQLYDLMGQREKAVENYKQVLSFKNRWGFDEVVKPLLKMPYALEADPGPLPPV